MTACMPRSITPAPCKDTPHRKRYTDTQAHRHTDKQIHRHIQQTHASHRCSWMPGRFRGETQTNTKTHTHTHTHTNTHTHTQTNTQTNTHTHTHIYTPNTHLALLLVDT